jgi:Spectrin repeat
MKDRCRFSSFKLKDKTLAELQFSQLADILSLAQQKYDLFFYFQVKRSLIESQPVGAKDEDTILLYLTKQKAFELELDSYAGIISETKNSAAAISQSAHPLAELVRHKDELLSREFSSLQKLSRGRRNALVSVL